MQLPKWSVEREAEVAQELAQAVPPFAGDGSKPVWTIDTPPPYPSGKWHIGAVAGYSLIDVIARSKRMEGFDVLFPWGVDRNGINIEFTVEKKSGKPMRMWERAAFNDACRDAITEFSDDMKRIGRRIGLSCNFDTGYETDSPQYRAYSQAHFLELFGRGLIVEDLRPNTYDPKLGTTIADAEVFYEERKTRLNDVTWTIKETGEAVTVATTRPELICACRMVLVHPENDATKHLIGKTAVLPVARGAGLSLEVPIKAHPHVKTDFGSGVMMVCSYGDQADVGLFRELNLDAVAAIGLDGRMTDAAGPYAGLKVEEARKKIIEDLEGAGKLPSFKTVDQKFPVSERSQAAVEIVSLKEWYVKQTHCTDDLRKVAKNMRFIPTKHRQILLDWIDTVTIDWPISRRRWYHTEIPLWFIENDGEPLPFVVVPNLNMDAPVHYKPWAQQPPADSRVVGRIDRKDAGSLAEFLAANPGVQIVGEQKVFDTWMDSSVSNRFILHPYRNEPWAKDFICSVRPQGRDIVRTWLYYTVLKSYLNDGKPAFENAWIHGMGMDKNGRKMSKSLGNVINPDEILDKTGSDAFRLWIAGECTIGDDFRINLEKIQGAGKFLQKLGNVASFVQRFEEPPRPESLGAEDEWILGELDRVTTQAVAAYGDLDFFTPANEVRSFVWNVFAPHYMEMVKGRAYNNDAAACWTLHQVVRRVVALLAPICPLFSHHVASGLYGENLHESAFPKPSGYDANTELTDAVVAFNSNVWKSKQEQGLSLAAPIAGIEIPATLARMATCLVEMHKLGS